MHLIKHQGYSMRKATTRKKFNMEPRLGRYTLFSSEVEEKILDLVKKVTDVFCGWTANERRKVAFEYAVR